METKAKFLLVNRNSLYQISSSSVKLSLQTELDQLEIILFQPPRVSESGSFIVGDINKKKKHKKKQF